jgi:PKD domain
MARTWLGVAVLIAALCPPAGALAALTSFGGPGTGDGQFTALNAIALDAAGNVYAVDGSGASRVQEFSNTGDFVRKWGSNGTGDGQFMGIYAIALGPSGNVYVGDYGNDRIEVFTADGTYLSQWATTDSPMGLAVDGGEQVWVSAGAQVTEYTSTGAVLQQGGVHGDANNEFWNMGDLALGPLADVYEIERNEVRVQRFAAGGAALSAWGQPAGGYANQAGAADGMFDQGVGGIAVLASGEVLVANAGRVQEFTANGQFLRKYGAHPGGSFAGESPQDVAVDGQGDVFIADGQAIRRLDTAVAAQLAVDHGTRLTSQAATFDADGSSQPLGSIARYDWDLDGDGTYEVTDGPATQTLRFAEAGTHTVGVRVIGSRGPASATTTRTVDVQASSAVLAPSPRVALTGQVINLDATGSALADSAVSDYSWDLDGDGVYERDTGPVGTTAASFAARGSKRVSVRVRRSGGPTDTATADLDVRAAPPGGEVGISINGGAVATNDPHVTLHVVWPKYSINALISNDGGFGAGSQLGCRRGADPLAACLLPRREDLADGVRTVPWSRWLGPHLHR